MALIGCKYACFLADGENTGIELDPLNKADITYNTVNGTIEGDDRTVENVNFINGASVAAINTDLLPEHAAIMFGDTKDSTGNTYTVTGTDNAPYGKYGFIVAGIRNGTNYWETYLFYKAKATRGAVNAQSRGANINLSGVSYTMECLVNDDDKCLEHGRYTTEAAAVAAVHDWCGISA